MDVYTGFDDITLEILAKGSQPAGVAPTFSSWSAEANGLGEAFRYVTKLPVTFPLAFFSDHGVGSHCILGEYEKDNVFRSFVTWNPAKCFFNKKNGKRFAKIIHMPHPFPLFWRMANVVRRKNATGTIVFLNHSTPELEYGEFVADSYVEELRALPQEYHPIVLCLHRNDILNGEHRKLRTMCDFPIITMGHAGYDGFCKRFYDTLAQFKFASSTIEMSTLFYCVDFGMPYFIYGTFERHESHHQIDQVAASFVRQLFAGPTNVLTDCQRDYVDMMLGKRNSFDRLRLSVFVWSRFISFSFCRLIIRQLWLFVTRLLSSRKVL